MKMVLGFALVALSLNACGSKSSKTPSRGGTDDNVIKPTSGDVVTNPNNGAGIPSTSSSPAPTPTPAPAPAPAPTPTDTSTPPAVNCDDPMAMANMTQEELMQCLMEKMGGGGGLPGGFPTP